MKSIQGILIMLAIFCFSNQFINAQNKGLLPEIKNKMLAATKYMVEDVSTNGGYVWYYLPDFSRRWGEMEAYKTMIWMQHPGTISMGHLFLNAHKITGEKYYYEAAQKAANAIIWGQSKEGGWNYMLDFAGDKSLKNWYNTIGKNGWRLEEFQHYYGNCTFDDDITSDAARFLLRIYLEELDPAYKPALDKAIQFILESQYPLGGWPQRYPLKYDFNKNGHPDYTSFYTFNDDVIWENINFLIQCYVTLGEERFIDPIQRGMNFYLSSQDACGAWGQQLNLNLETTGARTYEPAAFLPSTTCENAFLLLKFYTFTGDKKFLNKVPAAIKWLKKTQLPENQRDGRRTHPTFIDVNTKRPIYVHRKGSNVKYGYYYTDTLDQQLLSHYGGKCAVNLEELKTEYERLSKLGINELTKDSPLKSTKFEGNLTPQKSYNLNRYEFSMVPSKNEVADLLKSLDENNRWLSKHAMISHPYCGDGVKQELTDNFASTHVGDETDTSPFRDTSQQEYISTGTFIRNMNLLLNYIQSQNEQK